MICEVCLSEEKKEKEKYVLRTFGTPLEEIKELLEKIPFKYEAGAWGVDLFFHNREDWNKAKGKISHALYADSFVSMEEVVGNLLRQKGFTLSIAESCTGGLISARIVNVPGSSDYFKGGVIVYSNELKEKLLGVNRNTLLRYGAVSLQTCKEMLKGLKSLFKTETGIAVTGIAGPGGAEKKPQGLTYVGAYIGRNVLIEEHIFPFERNPNRFMASQSALNLLRRLLLKEVS